MRAVAYNKRLGEIAGFDFLDFGRPYWRTESHSHEE